MPQSSADRVDTIFALATGHPPAAVSIIRVSGPLAHHSAEQLSGQLPPPRCASLRRLIHPRDGSLLDEALLLRFDGPASASGEDTVEYHCHGGRAVVAAMLAALAEMPGLRLAEPGEFTRRAFENGRIDLTQAEGLADLIEAETETQRRAAIQMSEGGLRSHVEDWRERLVVLSARAEKAIDYIDEDGADDEAELLRDVAVFVSDLEQWLGRPSAEPLKDGVKVVFAGPPNVGKSSLVNAIVGFDRAIVSAEPGTTRDHIEVPLALGGVAVVLTDTAGLRATGDMVEAIGVSRSRALAETADVLVWLGDEPPPPHPRAVLVHPRADIDDRSEVPSDRLAVSARNGTGIAELLSSIGRSATQLLPKQDEIALNGRQRRHLENSLDVVTEAQLSGDFAIIANGLRIAIGEMDELTGRKGIDDVLGALFSRFCLGK